MGKSLLYKLFGFGKLPKKMVPILEREGIILQDEGIKGTVILRKFRAPGRYHSYKRSGFAGSIVVTKLRFAAFTFAKPIINVPIDNWRLKELDISIPKQDHLFIKFDAERFHTNWSGTVECRFQTPLASSLAEFLEKRSLEA